MRRDGRTEIIISDFPQSNYFAASLLKVQNASALLGNCDFSRRRIQPTIEAQVSSEARKSRK
jgi:hypothetical protein